VAHAQKAGAAGYALILRGGNQEACSDLMLSIGTATRRGRQEISE
jgi:hypothetical protein